MFLDGAKIGHFGHVIEAAKLNKYSEIQLHDKNLVYVLTDLHHNKSENFSSSYEDVATDKLNKNVSEALYRLKVYSKNNGRKNQTRC